MPPGPTDFVIYHNPDRMGYSVEEAFSGRAVTNKASAAHAYGARVWLIGGHDEPREYDLVEWFIIEHVRPAQQSGFKFEIAGEPHLISPPIPLGDLEWFPRFKETQANFSLGFNPIPAEFIPRFEALLR